MSGLPSWARYDAEKDVWMVQVHVQPGVRKNQVSGEHGGCLKLKIAAPAVDNKANKCLLGFVAELWGVPKRQVELVRGEGSRQKTVAVWGAGDKLPALPGIDNNNS
jgi:uncharacterized protein (TIGR00251 family)